MEEIKIFENAQFGQIRTALTENGEPSMQVVPMNFITEPNLYKCIFQSRKEAAEQFQDWVCGEVLPSIRKSGGYMVAKAVETSKHSVLVGELAKIIRQNGVEIGQNRLF